MFSCKKKKKFTLYGIKKKKKRSEKHSSEFDILEILVKKLGLKLSTCVIQLIWFRQLNSNPFSPYFAKLGNFSMINLRHSTPQQWTHSSKQSAGNELKQWCTWCLSACCAMSPRKRSKQCSTSLFSSGSKITAVCSASSRCDCGTSVQDNRRNKVCTITISH